jgi:hypothetical protein
MPSVPAEDDIMGGRVQTEAKGGREKAAYSRRFEDRAFCHQARRYVVERTSGVPVNWMALLRSDSMAAR